MFSLPIDIQRKIYLFDLTYYLHYNLVMKQLKNYGMMIRYAKKDNCLKKKHLVGNYIISRENSSEIIF